MKSGHSCHPPSASTGQSTLAARAALVSVALGSLMVAFDVTALNVGLPSIGRAFVVGIDRLQWIAGAYTLAFAALLLAAGSASDRFGAQRTFIIGLVVFMAASMACGAAPGIGALIAARTVQGVGAALMLPSSMALLANGFPDPTRRARAISLWGGISAVGLVAGPLLGGLLCQLAGWRVIFYLNAPLCVIAIGSAVFCGERCAEHPRKFDLFGVVLSGVALAAITFALIEAPVLGWSAAIIVTACVVGVTAAASLVVVERRISEPMLSPRLFASAPFRASVGIAFLQTFAYFGALFVLPVALQMHGSEPLEVGLRLAPMTITTGIAAALSGRLADAFGTRRIMTLGMLAGAAGALVLYACDSGQEPFAFAAVLLGFGGATLPLIVVAALAEVPPSRAGIASGVVNTARQSGGVLGIALLGALMNNGRHDAQLALLVVAAAFFGAAALGFVCLYRPGSAATSVEA